MTAREAVQLDRRDMRAGVPGRLELRSEGEQGQNRNRRNLLQQHPEQLHRRGITPLQIFEQQQQRLAFAQRKDPGDQRLERFRTLLLGSEPQLRSTCGVREIEQGRQERDDVWLGESQHANPMLELCEPLLMSTLFGVANALLQEFDQRKESAVFCIGRAAAFEPRVR